MIGAGEYRGQRHRAQVQASQQQRAAASPESALTTPRLASDQTDSSSDTVVRPLPSPLAQLAGQAHHPHPSAAAEDDDGSHDSDHDCDNDNDNDDEKMRPSSSDSNGGQQSVAHKYMPALFSHTCILSSKVLDIDPR